MNKVFLCGRLTRDPEVRVSNGESQITVARFSVAVDRPKKDGNDSGADFINCVAFGKTAETIEKYLGKGRKILVEGHWQTGSYTNKDGDKVYTNDCVVDKFEFADSKSEGATSTPTESNVGDGFMNIPEGVDSDLPF